MLESTLMRLIQVAASNLGHRVFRNNVGVAKTLDARVINFGLCKGSSDLIGLTRDGRFLAIEVKTERGKLSQEQKAFLAMVNRMGGCGIVARSVQDLENIK